MTVVSISFGFKELFYAIRNKYTVEETLRGAIQNQMTFKLPRLSKESPDMERAMRFHQIRS